MGMQKNTSSRTWLNGAKQGWAAKLVLQMLLICIAAPPFARGEDPDNCTPNFPFKQGWQGADAAYSIPLPDGRSVWIFGDTLYGEKRASDKDNPRMVRNSIGISSCDRNTGWKLDYVIRLNAEGQPEDFFKAQHEGTWYWALDGFLAQGGLWVTLLRMRNPPNTKAGALRFETCGADLAKVSGLDADPQKWKLEYFPLIPGGVGAYPSAAAVVEGGYVYLFALYETEGRPEILTRIPIKGLTAPAKNVQYLSKRGTWEPGLKPEDAMHVMEHGNTEMSVKYHPGIGKWLAVVTAPQFFSDAILLRTAPSLTGPWTEGEVIYHVPEMQKSYAGYDQDTFCYAAKEHPEFRGAGSLLFTYVCNTLDVKRLSRDLGIYFPKAVRVPLTLSGAAGAADSPSPVNKPKP